MTQMTSEQILARLAQITGKSNAIPITTELPVYSYEHDDSIHGNGNRDVGVESTTEPVASPIATQEQLVGNTGEAGGWSEELKAIAIFWRGVVSGRGVIIENGIQMSKKDYNKYIKGKTQDDILSDPLLYVLFRSEDQSEVNFLNWLDKFPKAKDESKQQK